MRNNKPIGVFDSGLGGLSVVRALKKILPGGNIVYLGDTGRVPYGGRTRETIIRYATEDMAFLQNFDCKAIISACGTVSTNIPEDFAKDIGIPFTGIVRPTALAAVKKSKTGRIGVIATAASIRSRVFGETISKLNRDAAIFQVGCPLLVPLVENNFMEKKPSLVKEALDYYLAEFKGTEIDTLILGCTHYPALEQFIARAMPGVELVDSGWETATYAAEILGETDALSLETEAKRSYYVTDGVSLFSETAHVFLGEALDGPVTLARLDMK